MSGVLELGSLPRNTLSYTAYNMFLRCPTQFMYRYLEGLIEPPKSTLILGRATHKGLEVGFKEHLETGAPPPLPRVKEAAAAEVDEQLKATPPSEVQWGASDTPGKVKDDSIGLLTVYDPYRLQTAPAKVEEGFEIGLEGADYSINGRIDLQTAHDAIVDFKTTQRTPSPSVAENSEQLTLYQIATGVPTSLEIHALVRKAKPEVVIYKARPRTPERVKALLENIQKVSVLIRAGIYTKAAEDGLNSPCGYCGFYERCRGKKRSD